MSLVKDYFAKTKEWMDEYGPKTVVLMQVGAFFEVYGILERDGTYSGSRIVDVTTICDLLIANKASGGVSSCGGDTTSANEEKLPVKMAGFRDHQLDKYLKRLNESGWTCVVYTQDACTKNTTRSLHGVYSPGTFFSDDTTAISNNTMAVWLENKSNVSSRHNEKTYIGIAVADIFTGRTIVCEYITDERHSPSAYDDLERTISIYMPSEVIIISAFDDTKVKQIIQYIGVDEEKVRIVNTSDHQPQTNNGMIKNAKKCEKQSYQMETINTFFGGRMHTHIESEQSIDALLYDMCINVYAFQALVFLLNYIYAHNPNLASKIEFPVIQHHNSRLVLANHSLKQLNMISDDGSWSGMRSNAKMSSVSTLLNSAITAGGKRTFTSILHNPICDTIKLKEHYDITELCLTTDLWKDIRDALKDIKDVEKLNRKLILKRFTPRDVATLLDSVKQASDLYDKLCEASCWKTLSKYLSEICNINISQMDFKDVIEFIDARIVIDEALDLDSCGFNQYSAECVNKGSCFIKEGISKELDEACKGGLIWQQQLASIVDYFDMLIAKTESGKSKSKLVKLHETPTMPPTILLTKRRSAILKLEMTKLVQKNRLENKTKIEDNHIILCADTPAEFAFNIKDVMIENASSKMDDIISSEQIRELTYKMRNSKDLFNEILSSVFKNICNQLLKFTDDITHIADFVRYVDVIQTRCYIADKYSYCKPQIISNSDNMPSFVDAHGLRHPLIEHIQTNEIYVTNDISLGKIDNDNAKERDDNISGILLFGTNAVGKTSIIKALGISVIMAQAGLYVPCKSFRYRPYTALFTRILGNDNIHRGLSTFAVEMLELRTILKMANQNSLILGDELCSGTESDSALSIFATGIERLHQAKSSFIFATHFHEIVDYDEIKSLERLRAKHMTVIYNREMDMLIYDRKLKDGAGDSMYGLEVCKALDLPQDFLERAHSLRSKYNQRSAADVNMKASHFNQKKIMGRCELCGKQGKEVHHLQHQKNANEHGRIKHFRKNHLANLISLCEECHDGFHKTDTQYERKKTTKGYMLFPVD